MLFDAELLDALRTARHAVIFTGAGVSAESGIPTFRDAQTGLWARFRAEDLATPEAFERDPGTVWNWYTWRRSLIQQARPNPAHDAIVLLERRILQVTVITQNVDGLHQLAGSRQVIELHGNISRNLCSACMRQAEAMDEQSLPPRSSCCQAYLRPGVVWFGEALPSLAWAEAAAAINTADLMLCIGTSSLVEPAASLPRRAGEQGTTIVQINPVPTAHDAVARHVLRGKAGEIMPRLLAAAWPGLATHCSAGPA